MSELHEPQDLIVDLAQRTGLTEKEARVLYHLDQASKHYNDVLDEGGDAAIAYLDSATWTRYQQALVRELMARVAERDHPEGWSRGERRERGWERGDHPADPI